MGQSDEKNISSNPLERIPGGFSRLDRKLQEFKGIYSNLSEGEKGSFRDWLEKLSELNDPEVRNRFGWASYHIGLAVTFDLEDVDQYESIVPVGQAAISPKVLILAIQAWDNGEEFRTSPTFPLVD